MMRQTRADRHGYRVRALIVVLWRGGLRVQEALSLAEPDLDARRGSMLVRNGKGGRHREIGLDAWGWEQLAPWLACPRRFAPRPAVLRDRRPDPRAGMVSNRCRGSSSTARARRPVCAEASRRISSAMLTRSSSPARAVP